MRFIFLALVLTGMVSCQVKDFKKLPDDVQVALDSAKDNQAELMKVITHYSEKETDSLKLKAAYFLIANMPEHSYVKAKLVDTAKHLVKFNVLDYPDYKTMVKAWDSVESTIGSIDYVRDTVIYDINTIKSDYLIKNIDLAFQAWNYPWAKFLSFDEFCEYVLPYRGSNEPIEDWRESLMKKYHYLIDSMKDTANPIEMASLINNEIKSWYKFDARFYRHPTDLGFDEMLHYKMGRCEDMTNLAIYAMRSMGVPVMSDYVPYWPNTGNNHAWNATLTKDHKVVIFMGGLDNPGEYKLNNKKAKVYRKTYAHQKEALVHLAPEYEALPPWLGYDAYIDVTADYVPVRDVVVNLTETQPDSVYFAYLAVFNSGEWKAIHWGQIDSVKRQATFTDMGLDIVYMPAYYKKKDLLPAAYPFILDSSGQQHLLKPDTTLKITLTSYSTTARTIVKTTDGIKESNFEAGKMYSLFYWDGEWKKIGEEIAKNTTPLVFENVPSGALYWLTVEDSNKEERIFTIDNEGKQIWW